MPPVTPEQFVEAVATAFRPLWDEQGRRLTELEKLVAEMAEEEFHRPAPPRDLRQFAQDVLAVLETPTEADIVAAQAMCQRVLDCRP